MGASEVDGGLAAALQLAWEQLHALEAVLAPFIASLPAGALDEDAARYWAARK